METTRSHWRGWLRYVGTSAVVGLLSLAASFVFYARRARAAQGLIASEPKPVKPLIARSTTRFYDPSGKLAFVIASHYVRYSDHSEVWSGQDLYPKTREGLTHIVDRQTEREISSDPLTKSVITMHFTRAEQQNTSGAWEESCPVEDMANASPGGVFFGHQTLHIVKQWGGTDVTERWMIPELDCFSVKEIDTSSGARNVKVVQSLQEGEPDRSLMAVPPDYTERSPAAVEDLREKTTGEGAFGRGLVGGMEKNYQRRKLQ